MSVVASSGIFHGVAICFYENIFIYTMKDNASILIGWHEPYGNRFNHYVRILLYRMLHGQWWSVLMIARTNYTGCISSPHFQYNASLQCLGRLMSRVCQVTGRRIAAGNRVSHSNRKTKRKFCLNLHKRRFWVPSRERYVTLKVSARGIRTIDKKGIEKVISELSLAAR